MSLTFILLSFVDEKYRNGNLGNGQSTLETLPQVPDQQEAEEASHHYVERERRTGGESFYQIVC
ncbi:Hypothetical predicted protein [Olea europaea subsp. europaea]|uniref:Uncharacterized protein n=1 Tax=Olea europaea subsp. europaea TaxID=158383 RepID=A0A8S0Q0J5_OLEEU|nr:Hypothetical predicted protein [Olea europaea subsp. europaea]